jgi:predicted amidohydrolase YtcJ
MKTKLTNIFIIILLLLANTMEAQENKKAFINGVIFTVNSKQPLAEAVLTAGGKIIFVGSTAEVMKMTDNNTEVTDLGGKLLLPGFIDNHTHFSDGGFYLLGIDLRNAKSTAEFKKILKDYDRNNKPRWITGGYWDHEAWEVKNLPTKEMVDEAVPNTPVFISRFDGHMGVANTAALKAAGVTKDTKSPKGGLIVKDSKTGEPTGILKDDAMNLVLDVIPAPTDEEFEAAILRALKEANENGFTSIQDMTPDKEFSIYKKFEKEGKLTCRMYTRTPVVEYKKLIEQGIKAGDGTDMVRGGSLKAFADGSLGSSTALFFEHYVNEPENNGLAMEYVTNGNLKKWALEADKNKLQLCVHAIGDSANYLMLQMFKEIVETNPKWDRRFRIEHAQHVRFEDMPLFKELGVIASVQPYHCIDDGVWAEKRIGKERLKYTYPFKSFIDLGIPVCFGSDWFVAPLNAIYGIYAAVTRRTLDDKNPDGWQPEQKLTVEQAIKCYTLNNAYAAFQENVKGSIEPGKFADFVVLSDNILTIAPEKIRDVKVEMTILGGQTVYKRK